jgi:hypothetical protein
MKSMTVIAAAAAAAAALGLAAPAAAQGAQTAPAPTAATATPVDPARLKEAETLVGLMMSDAAIEKMFAGMGNAISSRLVTTMMPAAELEKARQSDPHFEQRMDRIMSVTMAYMREMMADIAPEMRHAMAVSYARRLPLDELRQQVAFVRTPAGTALFSTMYDVMSDPEYAQFTTSFAQRMMGDMPKMIERMKAATADLPPPPKKP